MISKPFYTLAIFLTVVCTSAIGQRTKLREEKKDTIISLVRENNSAKTVILLQKGKFVVKSSLENLRVSFENWINNHPQLSDDKELLRLILAASKDNQEVNASAIAKEFDLINRLNFRIADMILEGNCYIINRANGKKIPAIRFQTFRRY